MALTGENRAVPLSSRVRPKKLKKTDLASIPFFLRWFAAGYGRHTPAALLHDQLRRPPETPLVSREESDRIFRLAMRELGVPFIRRLIMWAAVVAAARVLASQTPNEQRSGRALVRAVLTLGWAALLVLIWLWVAGLIGYDLPQWVPNWVAPRSPESILVAALAAPIALGLLWDREFGAGVVAGWAIPVFFPFGMAGVFVTFLAYGVIEFTFMILIWVPKLIWFLIRLLASLLGLGETPAPPQPVPGPTPWGGALLRLWRRWTGLGVA